MLNNNEKIHIFTDKRKILDENGFTLIEVLIAASIFAIGLLAVSALLITSFRGNRVGDELTKATMLAQMQLETLKSADFNTDALKGGTTTASLASQNYVDANNPIDETGVNGGIFTRTWTIANNTTFSRLVTVTVTWNPVGGGGGTRRVVMSSVTRGGGL